MVEVWLLGSCGRIGDCALNARYRFARDTGYQKRRDQQGEQCLSSQTFTAEMNLQPARMCVGDMLAIEHFARGWWFNVCNALRS